MRLITKSEFAAERDVHPSRVSQWLKDGRIVETTEGRIDADDAHARLGAMLDRAKGSRRDGNVTSNGPEMQAATEKPAQHKPDEAAPTQRDDSGYWEHRTRQAKADAQLKEMQALERAGALVRADEVAQEINLAFRMARNALQGMVDQLAPVLDPASPARAHKLLTASVEKTLRELSGGLAGRAAGAASAREREETLQ